MRENTAVLAREGEQSMRQFWGYQNSEFTTQSSGKPSVFFAYSCFRETVTQSPIPAELLIAESP